MHLFNFVSNVGIKSSGSVVNKTKNNFAVGTEMHFLKINLHLFFDEFGYLH